MSKTTHHTQQRAAAAAAFGLVQTVRKRTETRQARLLLLLLVDTSQYFSQQIGIPGGEHRSSSDEYLVGDKPLFSVQFADLMTHGCYAVVVVSFDIYPLRLHHQQPQQFVVNIPTQQPRTYWYTTAAAYNNQSSRS